MGRMYSVEFENVAVAAAQDFFELTPADDKPIKIHSCVITQITDVGDANEEMLRVKIIRGHTTSGSGGSAPTPAVANPIDTAAGFTAEVNNTTIASVGTAVDLWSEAFNIREGWHYHPTPEEMLQASQANSTIVVRLMAAPGSSINMSGTIMVEEVI